MRWRRLAVKRQRPRYGKTRIRALRRLLTAIAVALAVSPSAPLHAASLDGRSLRAGLGIVRPEALPATPWLVVAGTCRLSRLAFEPEAGFWSRSETAFGLESTARDVHAGVSLTWSPLRKGRTRLLAGAGGSAHLVSASGGPVAGETASETRLRPGLQGFVAVEVRIGPRSAAFAAGRADWILRRGVSNERETRIYAGLRLGF